MKVLLIYPPATNLIRDTLPPVVEDSTGVLPPLGLLYVAAHAEKVPGCEVEVVDCQAQRIAHEDLATVVERAAPDVVGVQVMTYFLIDAALVAKTVRRAAPRALIVFGGPHVTLFPAETLSLDGVDAIVVGEGEYPMEGLLTALGSGAAIEDVPGVLTRHSPPTALPPRREFIKDLDRLAAPARHLLDLSRYTSVLAAHGRVTTMMTSRGCPGRCIFCDRPQMGTLFRKRSAQNVVDEMRLCVDRHGIQEIVFYDDTFTIDRGRVLEICDLITNSGLKVSWDVRARVDTMTPEMIARMAEAGCTRIHYGVETGSARLQKYLQKNVPLDRVHDVFALTKKQGIETLGYFMIGLPTEGIEEIEQTFDLITSLPMDYVSVSVFTPYPGTEIYRQAVDTGFYDRNYWREFAQDPRPGFSPRYWNEHFTDDELLALLKQAYRRFYRRPSYILGRLVKVRSLGELLRKGIFGVKLLRELHAGRPRADQGRFPNGR